MTYSHKGLSLALAGSLPHSVYLHQMARRAFIIILFLFLLASIPLFFYLWAKNNGRPTPFTIPGLERGTPQGVVRGTKPINLSHLQNSPLGIIDPMSNEDCFVPNGGTCQFTNWATASGTIQLEIDSPTAPNNKVSLGLFFGYQGALQKHYQFGLANGGSDAKPIYDSIRVVMDQGNRYGINPMFLLAYYDFLLEEAQAQNIPPQDLGLPLSDAFPLSPDPADVASTFRVAWQVFTPPEENIDANGQPLNRIVVADDELSAWLKTQEISPAGRAVVYTTSQLFGTEFASNAFTEQRKLQSHYDRIFRDPRFAGIFPLTVQTSDVNPFHYFYRQTPDRELVVCQGSRAVSCSYSFIDTTLAGDAQVGACVGTPFFNEFCADGTLQPLY